MPPTTRKPLVDGLGDPAAVVKQVTEGYLLLDETVIAFADADYIAGIVLLIARRTGLSVATVVRALEAESSGPPTLLCRAAGLGANGFSGVRRGARAAARGGLSRPRPFAVPRGRARCDRVFRGAPHAPPPPARGGPQPGT